jgi:hypothetical protein
VLKPTQVEVDRPKGEVRISKIFKWYSVDFGATDVERLRWILPFLQVSGNSNAGESRAREETLGRGNTTPILHLLIRFQPL